MAPGPVFFADKTVAGSRAGANYGENLYVWSPTAQPKPCPNGFKQGCIAFLKSLVFMMAFLHLVPRIGISTLFAENYRALPGALNGGGDCDLDCQNFCFMRASTKSITLLSNGVGYLDSLLDCSCQLLLGVWWTTTPRHVKTLPTWIKKQLLLTSASPLQDFGAICCWPELAVQAGRQRTASKANCVQNGWCAQNGEEG
eukprot:scaffold58082_cov21-Tisochrysis_lutea.AAC.1